MTVSKNPSSIRQHRLNLGMSTTELAYRLGISQSSVVRLEHSEQREAITLGSLKRAAKALGCELEYRLRPQKGLQNTSVRKKYYGRLRISRRKFARTYSRLQRALIKQEVQNARSLTPKQRLYAACALSQLTASFKQCSNKPL